MLSFLPQTIRSTPHASLPSSCVPIASSSLLPVGTNHAGHPCPLFFLLFLCSRDGGEQNEDNGGDAPRDGGR